MKNPVMTAWLSWANQATAMWTTAVMSAARRNQATAIRTMTSPPKPPTKRKAKSSKT